MKKKYFVLLAVFLLVFSASVFSQDFVEKEKPKPWSGIFETSWVYNHVYHGLNFLRHNEDIWMIGLRMADPSGAFSSNAYTASTDDYSEYGAEITITGKFFSLTVYPLTWKSYEVADSGIILGASLFKSIEKKSDVKVGFLGALVSKAKELNGTYYYMVLCLKDLILGINLELEGGMNKHFFAPGADGPVGSIKLFKQLNFTEYLGLSVYAQKYFISDKRINPYNELSAGACLSIKLF